MASIDIQHPHTMNPAHARQAVQEVADKLAGELPKTLTNHPIPEIEKLLQAA